MNVKSAIAFGCLLLSATPALSQTDFLSYFDGLWASVSPPGPIVLFYQTGFGTRGASLPVLGQASVRLSNGEYGSNLKVSGEGFDCYYFVARISSREMIWEIKGGRAVCPSSAHYVKSAGDNIN
jgi:hypothetical protein